MKRTEILLEKIDKASNSRFVENNFERATRFFRKRVQTKVTVDREQILHRFEDHAKALLDQVGPTLTAVDKFLQKCLLLTVVTLEG